MCRLKHRRMAMAIFQAWFDSTDRPTGKGQYKTLQVVLSDETFLS